MKSSAARLTYVSVCLAITMSGFASNVQSQQPANGQRFVPGTPVMLFDGHSLDGWGRRDGSPNTGWDVEEGAIHRKSGGGDLYYKYELADFELHFQWKIAAGGNSGLKYRVRDYNGSWLGCEYQLLDDDKHGDANKTAGLYDVIDPPDFKPIVKPDVWNYSRIVVCGNHIEHWLNGIQMVSVTVGSPRWQSAVAGSKFANHPGFGENRVGRLFLQDHGDEVWFRNLVLIPRKCPELVAVACPVPDCSHGVTTRSPFIRVQWPSRFCTAFLRSPRCQVRGFRWAR